MVSTLERYPGSPGLTSEAVLAQVVRELRPFVASVVEKRTGSAIVFDKVNEIHNFSSKDFVHLPRLL